MMAQAEERFGLYISLIDARITVRLIANRGHVVRLSRDEEARSS